MRTIKLSLDEDSSEEKKSETKNTYEDESKKLKKINEIEDENDKLSIKTESDKYLNIEEERKPILWGNENKVVNCFGDNIMSQVPPFFIKKGKNGIVYIHLYWNNGRTPAEGQIYHLLNSLSEEDVVHLHIHEVPFWRTTLLQSAIQNSKATIHTFVYMLEPSGWEMGKFFVWMVGDVLEPIPCDVIGLVEPTTIFSFSRGPSEGRKNSLAHDSTLKQFWYDFAVKKGLLKLEEIEELQNNKMVLIKGINSRIETANKITE